MGSFIDKLFKRKKGQNTNGPPSPQNNNNNNNNVCAENSYGDCVVD